jgi:aminoglycoside N3'-acetyltransferase
MVAVLEILLYQGERNTVQTDLQNTFKFLPVKKSSTLIIHSLLTHNLIAGNAFIQKLGHSIEAK